MMEILHLVYNKPDVIYKKMALTVDQLATAQVKLGYSVHVWEMGSSPYEELQQRPYKTRHFHVKSYVWATTGEINEAIRQLKKNTIVHMHGGFVPLFFTFAFHLNKRNIPFVYTPHGTYNKSNIQASGLSKKMYFKMFENSLMQWCAALHFEGPSEKSLIDDPEITNDKKVLYIPNGLSNESSLPPAKFNEFEEPVFAWFGKPEINNGGLDILVQGFAEYKQKYSGRGVLWIVGEGDEKKQLYALVTQLGIQNNVFFKGNVIGLRKFEMLNKVNVFLRPSRFEYDPSIVLEAASAWVPSVVSRETNMGEYIAEFEAGIVLDQNTPHHLAKAIAKCASELENYGWEQKRKNAHRMVTEKFQWNNIAKEHIKVYERILANL